MSRVWSSWPTELNSTSIMLVLDRLKIGLRMRLWLTLLFMFLGASSLLVMLLAMSFNVGVLLAVILGEVRGARQTHSCDAVQKPSTVCLACVVTRQGVGHFYFSTDFYHNLLAAGTFH
jgi:hypothetical protein